MYFKAKFYSAKVPIELGKNTSDVVFDLKQYLSGYHGYSKRSNFANFTNLIEFSQISNVLHVLLGARPAPSKRESFHHRCEYIDSIAKNALIKIHTPMIYLDKNGKEHPILEMTQGKKSIYNSHSSQAVYCASDKNIYQGFLTWSSLKKKFYYYFPEKYNKIINTFEEVSGLKNISSKYTLVGFLEEMMKDENKWECIKTLSKEVKCGALLLNNIGSFTASNATNLATLTINTNPVYKVSLDGEIIFELNDTDAKVLLNGNKMATFLDSGFLEIVEMFYEIDIQDEVENGFKLVKNLN